MAPQILLPIVANNATDKAANPAAKPAASPALAKSNKLRLNVRVEPGASVEVGQHLKIDIDDGQAGSTWLWAVFGAYGLPLAGMLIATGGASALWGAGGAVPASSFAELRVLVSAGAGLFSGIVAWRLFSRRLLQMSEHGLCLLSARIVSSVNELPMTPINIGSKINE